MSLPVQRGRHINSLAAGEYARDKMTMTIIIVVDVLGKKLGGSGETVH